MEVEFLDDEMEMKNKRAAQHSILHSEPPSNRFQYWKNTKMKSSLVQEDTLRFIMKYYGTNYVCIIM
jgi:hypothetical protein